MNELDFYVSNYLNDEIVREIICIGGRTTLKHTDIEWDSNGLPQYPKARRPVMPQTARPLRAAVVDLPIMWTIQIYLLLKQLVHAVISIL
jgi:hypothetical protein